MLANCKFRVAKKVVNKYLTEFEGGKKTNKYVTSLNRTQWASSTTGAN